MLPILLIGHGLSAQAQRVSSSEEILDLSSQTIKVTSFNTHNIPTYPDEGLTQSNIDEFLDLFLEEHGKSGSVTINQLHSAADELTRLYRKAGYLFHRAYIPEQKVKGSKIKIEVRKGKLSSIHIYNQRKYSANKLISFFDDQIGSPIKKERIEKALFNVNSLPGLQVFGYFSAGERADETRLNLRVLEDNSIASNISIDNYGTKTTGVYRLTLNSHWINPLGISDSIQFGLSKAYDPDNSLYGYIQYKVPVFSNKNDIYISYSNNDYELGDKFSALLVNGKSDNYRIGTDYRIITNAKGSLTLNAEYYKHDSNIKSKFSDLLNKDTKLERWQLEVSHNIQASRLWSLGALGTRRSSQNTSEDIVEKDYFYSYASLALGWNFLSPWIPDIKLQGYYQQADDYLSPADKLLLTGESNVRGIESGYVSVDTGSIINTEISWNNSQLKFFLFSDSAKGKKIALSTEAENSQYNITSAGAGLSWRVSNNWSAKLQSAHVLSAKQHQGSDNNTLSVQGDNQVLAEINYQVRF